MQMFENEQVRARVYRGGLAAVALAVAYGLVSGADQVAGWTALVTALVGNGLATVNTSTQPGS